MGFLSGRRALRLLARSSLLFGAVLSGAAPVAAAEALAASSVCEAAFSAVDQQMREDIAASVYPGAVYAISRGGRIVHQAALGLSHRAPAQALSEDAIFRLASMSKPITAVAIMMLVDEGKLALDDPVARYLPEFAQTGAATAPGSAPAPLPRPISLRHLLTHTSGLVAEALDEAQAKAFAGQWQQRTTLAAAMPQYAKLPLQTMPGTHFSYSTVLGFDVLARVVEVVSGQGFEQFLQTRLFTPLDMRDTGFRLSAVQQKRLVTLYRATALGLLPEDSALNSETYFSGAAGLYGSTRDYLRFAQMLAGHGRLGEQRILSRAAADALSAPQLPAGFPGLPAGMAWGLGMRVVARDPQLPAGSYGWSGAYGSHFWIDPQNDQVTVLMLNLSNAGGANAAIARAFEARVMRVLPFCAASGSGSR